jgi:endonuclease/exonuclease/phosphatase family metal-dependent hydrolase
LTADIAVNAAIRAVDVWVAAFTGVDLCDRDTVSRRVIAWLLVVPWAIWVIVRVLGVERGYPFVELMAYTPYVLPVALAAGAVAALLRRWAPAAVAGVSAIVLAVLLIPRVTGDSAEARAGGPQLRVLTANAYQGSVPPETLVELVRSERVDLLSLQELTPQLVEGLERAGIGELLPHEVLTPETAIYSRLPLRRLPALEGSRTEMAAAELDVAGAPPVRAISVHAAAPITAFYLDGWRGDLRMLPAARPRGPVQLLAGDFNATLDHASLRELIDRGYRDAAEAAGAGLEPTWQGHRAPPVTIDHVLLPERAGVLGVSVHDLPRSDHNAVLAVLALPEG